MSQMGQVDPKHFLPKVLLQSDTHTNFEPLQIIYLWDYVKFRISIHVFQLYTC